MIPASSFRQSDIGIILIKHQSHISRGYSWKSSLRHLNIRQPRNNIAVGSILKGFVASRLCSSLDPRTRDCFNKVRGKSGLYAEVTREKKRSAGGLACGQVSAGSIINYLALPSQKWYVRSLNAVEREHRDPTGARFPSRPVARFRPRVAMSSALRDMHSWRVARTLAYKSSLSTRVNTNRIKVSL